MYGGRRFRASAAPRRGGLVDYSRYSRPKDRQPSSVRLNQETAGIDSAPVRHGPLARIRVLVLLVAFGIGLAGQAVAFPLMPMAQNDGSWLTVPVCGSGGCPGCDRNDFSQASARSCTVAFCSVSPAILPQAPSVKPASHPTFFASAGERVQGITVRPDLGPPRPTRHA
jgi:hypothetical protein